MLRDCKLCSESIENCLFITNVSISQRNDSQMDGNLNVYKCIKCNFYFTSSHSDESNYDHYYLTHNNYGAVVDYYDDKTLQSIKFLVSNIQDKDSTILDYGCGNKQLYNGMKKYFANTDCYDVGYPPIEKTSYDYIIVSHVLEHIYNPKEFLSNIRKHINKNGNIYIEVPNADGYLETKQSYGILQEINIEHINFFTPSSLSSFMESNGFSVEIISTGHFNLNNICDYPVIRGLFKLSESNKFEKYITFGKKSLEDLESNLPNIDRSVFIYGCGQFLYKIINILKNKYDILAIIDDNANFKDKTLLGIPIYNSEYLKGKSDIHIIITSRIQKEIISKRINELQITSTVHNVF